MSILAFKVCEAGQTVKLDVYFREDLIVVVGFFYATDIYGFPDGFEAETLKSAHYITGSSLDDSCCSLTA